MKYIIIDERIPAEAEAALAALGFGIFKLPPMEGLPEAICSHTDILAARVGKSIFLSRRYAEKNASLLEAIKNTLPYRLEYTSEEQTAEYPNNAIFNCLIIGNKAFAKTDSASPSLLRKISDSGCELIKVRQGYPACTVLPVSERSAITADRGMAASMVRAGIEVTLISDSHSIALPPYDFGFIGGAAATLGDTVYFFGNLNSHPDATSIKAAILRAEKKYISLMPDASCLFDLGGAIFYDKAAYED